MHLELADCENHMLRYALTLRSSEHDSVDWAKVNAAIVARWSVSALEWIKNQAWSGRCFQEPPAGEGARARGDGT